MTQAQYKKLVGINPSRYIRPNHPVEQVNWNNALSFLGKLNGHENKGYRLPTEAEWEYAARSGGQDENWAGTNDVSSLGNYVWYDKNSRNQTHPVGKKLPNKLGLYDMNGNVWEWCSDWYSDKYYANSPRNNPQGPKSGPYRVRRGGSWGYGPESVRSTLRFEYSPEFRFICLRFRVAFTA